MSEPLRDHRGDGAEALAWADTYADVGDFRFALRWLRLADGLIGRPLPAAYEAKRAVWTYAAGEGRPAAPAASS